MVRRDEVHLLMIVGLRHSGLFCLVLPVTIEKEEYLFLKCPLAEACLACTARDSYMHRCPHHMQFSKKVHQGSSGSVETCLRQTQQTQVLFLMAVECNNLFLQHSSISLTDALMLDTLCWMLYAIIEKKVGGGK